MIDFILASVLLFGGQQSAVHNIPLNCTIEFKESYIKCTDVYVTPSSGARPLNAVVNLSNDVEVEGYRFYMAVPEKEGVTFSISKTGVISTAYIKRLNYPIIKLSAEGQCTQKDDLIKCEAVVDKVGLVKTLVRIR